MTSLLTEDSLPISPARGGGGDGGRPAPVAQPATQRMSDSYQAVKAQTCQQVIEQLEARGSAADTLGPGALRAEIEQVVTSRSRRGQMALNAADRFLLI